MTVLLCPRTPHSARDPAWGSGHTCRHASTRDEAGAKRRLGVTERAPKLKGAGPKLAMGGTRFAATSSMRACLRGGGRRRAPPRGAVSCRRNASETLLQPERQRERRRAGDGPEQSPLCGVMGLFCGRRTPLQ